MLDPDSLYINSTLVIPYPVGVGICNCTWFIALTKVSISPKFDNEELIVSVSFSLEKSIGEKGANTLYSLSSNCHL